MSKQQNLRIVTFNIKHGARSDEYRGNPNLVAESCEALRADVLALQEVDKGVVRSRFADLASLAAEAAGMQVIFAETLRYKVGSYGNALLVRGDIEADHEVLEIGGDKRFNLKLSQRHTLQFGYEPRNAILATAKMGNRALSVAATHLSTNKQLSPGQLSHVVATLSERPAPHILLGDFNLPAKRILPYLSDTSLELVKSPPTFPAENPTRAIDHIAVGGLAVQAVSVERMPISDHRALVVDAQ